MGLIAVVYATDPNEVRRLHAAVKHDGEMGRVVGVYRLPAAGQDPTCPGTCNTVRESRKRANHTNGWGRHPERGHIVHECGRRPREWRNRIRTMFLDTFGINLLKRDETPALFRNPEGWGK